MSAEIATSTNGNSMLEAALRYEARGWSVIPIEPRGKRPRLASWKPYQERRATAAEIREWWRECPNANVGIVTGAVSGLVVVDSDGPAGIDSLSRLPGLGKKTPTAITGKGMHVYLRHPGVKILNSVRRFPGIDLRGDGGYVVAPPSTHESGTVYAFSWGLEFDPAEIPPSLTQLITSDGARDISANLDFSTAPTRSRHPETDRYVKSALIAEVGRVVAADAHQGNDELNVAAFNLGTLVGAGVLDRATAESKLLTAATPRRPMEEARRTIASGLDAGMARPRDISDVGDGAGSLDRTAHASEAHVAAAAAGPVALEIAKYRLDLMTVGDPPPRCWIVRGAIPRAVPFNVFGPGGCGKSLAMLDLCLKVATRSRAGVVDPRSFLGDVPHEAAGAAVFVTLEDDTAELHRRISALDPSGKRRDAPLYVIPGLDIPGFDPTLVRPEGRAMAMTRLAETGLDEILRNVAKAAGQPVRLLVLDPAGDLVDGDEDSAATIKPLMRYLRELAARNDCAVGIVGHVAKGQVDGDSVGVRGMRGSGAWTANARAAFGLWRPEDSEAVRFLRTLGKPHTIENISRVVYGRATKANHPGAPAGVIRYLQDPATGLLCDVTPLYRTEECTQADTAMIALVGAVLDAAHNGMPYQLDGAAGLYKRRASLPEPLRSYGEKRLRAIGNEALREGRILKCRGPGSRAPVLLDVPGGRYAVGDVVDEARGALEEVKKRRASRLEDAAT